MDGSIRIEDHAIWVKSVHDADLRSHIVALRDDEEIELDVGGVVGRWKKMRTGKDGRPTNGLRPVGAMKEIWQDWYRNRRGARVEIRKVDLADDYLAAGSELFSEWLSAEDEEAFRDL